MRRYIATTLLGLALSLNAALAADPVDEKTARKVLFSGNKADLVPVPDALDATQTALLGAILKGMKGEGLANYYGAVVASPRFFDTVTTDPGGAVLSGLFQVTERLHSPEAAENAAMRACNAAARKLGAPACVLAARILPRRWEARELSMSVSATANFKLYRRAEAPKAFAISPSTKAFGLAEGEDAAELAIGACNKKVGDGKRDCIVVISD